MNEQRLCELAEKTLKEYLEKNEVFQDEQNYREIVHCTIHKSEGSDCAYDANIIVMNYKDRVQEEYLVYIIEDESGKVFSTVLSTTFN